PQLAEVGGTVTARGKPVDKVQVEFWPERDGPRSVGVTDGQGRFTLTTDDGRRTGAVVGAHKVVLRDIGVWGDKLLGRKAEGVNLAKGKKPRVAAAYGDPRKSPLRKEVTAGSNDIALDVGPH